MDTNFSIADSTDWLGTTLAAFAPLESALRCQVCKDFFDTPMMTSCSHTFCSLCIRRCFAADGRCPTCRAADQDSKLRRNWTAQELVDSFQAARPQALELARKDAASIESASGHDEGKRTRRGGNNKGLKRKLEVRDSEDEEELDEGEAARRPARKTRTQPRRSAASPQTPEVIELDDDGASDFVDDEEEEREPRDGLVACPMCNKRMKEQAVFSHLDRCDGPAKDGGSARSTRTQQSRPVTAPHPLQQRTSKGPASSRNTEPLARLPQLNYSLLKDNALRKKLADLGIPQSGTRAQQIRRHTEWANLWNANVDSLRPRTKRELLLELDRWERSQTMESGGIVGGSSGAQAMKKDFDGDGWAKNNKSHFDELIASARGKRAASKGQTSEEDKPVATNGTSSSAEDRGSHQPYEDNEAALDKVRSSVDNAARGAPSVPHRNSNAMEESSGTPNTNNPTQNSTVYGQTVASPSSESPTRDNQDKAPSSLLTRIASPSSGLRKVPMFELPSEPIRDVDTELGK